MRVKCRSCGGEYEPTQRDGLRYFHACAPLPGLVLVRRNGELMAVNADATLPDADVLVGHAVERPNKRDENVQPRGARQGKPIAEGAGVERV